MTKFSSHSGPALTPEVAKPAAGQNVPPSPPAAGNLLKRERVKSLAHEAFIRELPCVICGDNTSTECAHVSYADMRYGKFGRGLGQKEESIWVVPLCGAHHRQQHTGNERKFWQAYEIDPCRVAAALFIRTQQYGTALEIINRARD